MPQSPLPPNTGYDSTLDELSSSELSEWDAPTATLTPSSQYGQLEQEPTQPEQLERRSTPTVPFDQSTFNRPTDSLAELRSFEPPTPQTDGFDGQPESGLTATQQTTQRTTQPGMESTALAASSASSVSTPATPPLTPKMPPPSPNTPRQPAPEPPAPTPPEQPASTAPASAELASWAAPTSSMPPAPASSPPSVDQSTPGKTSSSRTWATPKASTQTQPTTDDSWDPLEGWDPSAPLDASSPIGAISPSTSSGVPPAPAHHQTASLPAGGAQPNQQPLPPIGEPNLQPLTGSTSFDSAEFEVSNTHDFPANNQMASEGNDASYPMASSTSPEYGSPIDNGINTGRVVTMALLGGFALVVFFVLLASLF